ncbi:hypothetical protein RchiOBHm_Chr6g0279641 [Rosa chinensis]|uniref:Amino acid transporter transmembrane domain-containing protein n=1 Tax=Rosa chinensis TaxID=74649 RepID=A0A2P6PT33_ROSCH|nr:hypothetical protein RchiOBHm_Chr6g0279641 [Rosa chinensis]
MESNMDRFGGIMNAIGTICLAFRGHNVILEIQVPSSNGGLLIAISQFHAHDTSKVLLGLIYILVIVHCLSTFQIYAIVMFDKLESSYSSRKNKSCARWLRTALRVFFGGVTFFAAVSTFPFMESLASLTGGVALPLHLWLSMFDVDCNQETTQGVMWCVNMGLGCLGL